MWVLDNDVDDLYQTFSYDLDVYGQRHLVELVPNGANIFVTNANKKTYIKLLCLSKMKEEMSCEINAFLKGFNVLISTSNLGYFTLSEMDALIAGGAIIDVQDMRKYAEFDSKYTEEYRKWFWDILEEFNQSERSVFLYFISGSTKISYGGFKSSPIRVHYSSSDPSSLPIAHTW